MTRLLRTRLLRSAALVAVVSVVAAACSQTKRSTEAFCEQLEVAASFDEALVRLDPDELATAYPELESLGDVAPKEIVDEVDELIAAAGAVVESVSTATDDPTDAAEQALRDQQDRLAQIERAGRAVQSYARQQCNIDLGSTTTTPLPEPTAAPIQQP